VLGAVMPVKRLLAGNQLEPEEVEILTAAFNRLCGRLVSLTAMTRSLS
jgi:hypothetical protein